MTHTEVSPLRPFRKEGKQFFFFFLWTSVIPIILLFASGYYTTAYLLKKEALARHIALVEKKHGQLELFVKKFQVLTAAYGSDGVIRELTEKINMSCTSTAVPCKASKELSQYLIKNKIPLEPVIGIIDILNLRGTVIASSDESRIGLEEGDEKTSFSEATSIQFGKAIFYKELVSEVEEYNGGMMIHLTTPIASINKQHLEGVLLAHTENKELNKIVSEDVGKSTESYLVNKEKLMVTPSRFIADAVLKQKVDSPPVRQCIEHNLSYTGEYKDYRGKEVFGSSICDAELFGTLIVETDREEIFTEIDNLRNTALAILLVLIIIILVYALIYRNQALESITHIFPDSLSSRVTLIAVFIIIFLTVSIAAFVFSRTIDSFVLNQKTGAIENIITQQATRHLNGDSVSPLESWSSDESQKKFKDFGEEVLHSSDSARAVQIHTIDGVLAWSSLQNAEIGSMDEADEVAEAIKNGGAVQQPIPSTINELGSDSLLGIYVTLRGPNNNPRGVAETYIDIGDSAQLIHDIRVSLAISASAAAFIILILLRFILRRQEAKIVAQSIELTGIISSAPVGIYTVSRDGIIEVLNPAAIKETGIRDTREILGKNIFEIDYYKNSGLTELIHEGLNGKEFKQEITVTTNESSSRKTYHYFHGTPLRNNNGEVDHLLLMVENITERRELENKISQYTENLEGMVKERVSEITASKARAEALLASLGEGMIATNIENKIISMNKAAEEIVGWKFEEIKDKIMTTVIPATDDSGNIIPAEKRVCQLASVEGNELTMSGKMHFTTKSGRSIPVAVTATHVIIDGINTGAVVIFRDTSKEDEIEKTRRDILSLASHQLRTPLSGTKWLIETLQKGIHGSLTKTQEEYLNEIYKINVHMTTLVHDMLGVLRLEGDSAASKREIVMVDKLLEESLYGLKDAARSKKVALNIIGSKDGKIYSNYTHLKNILESLISNAINYSEEGSSVEITTEQKKDEFIFSIKDFGIGIPEEEQDRIFERFYRTSNAKTFDTDGTGLGLYIASTLAKKIDATITYESEEGKGSTFYAHVPHPVAS